MIDTVKNISTDISATYTKLKNSDSLSKEAVQTDFKIREIEEKEIKPEETKKDVDYSKIEKGLKEILFKANVSIEFTLDKESNEMIMRIIDDETEEVIRQFPSDISLKIARIVSGAIESGGITNVQV